MKYQLSKTVTVLGKNIIKPDKRFSFLAYLLQGEKNVLIDTVPERSREMFFEELQEYISLGEIDALILNHSESDHSGCVKELIEKHPEMRVYCTEQCRNRMVEEVPNANYHIVGTGDSVKIGTFEFDFVATPGLHWDDNMATYFKDEAILFSNDLFGQYLASETSLDHEFNEEEVVEKARGYFEAVFEVSSMEERKAVLPLLSADIEIIAPGHGVVLKNHKKPVVEYYRSKCQV